MIRAAARPRGVPGRRVRMVASSVMTRRHLWSALLVSVAACGGGGDHPVDAGTADASPACQLATTYQDFTSIQENIFKRQCAFMDCHDATAPEAHLDLTGTTAHDQLVDINAESNVAAGWKRVVAGSPSTSYLMIMLGRYTGPIDPDVGTMPQNSPLLCDEKLDAIERWITAGAAND